MQLKIVFLIFVECQILFGFIDTGNYVIKKEINTTCILIVCHIFTRVHILTGSSMFVFEKHLQWHTKRFTCHTKWDEETN